MSLTFKLLSLVVRTAAKPIGNYIKRQAKEHEGFRRFAINQAQRVHRIDMRMRLGLLHDAEAQQRMHEREQKAAEEKKRKAEAPTVRTAEEQKKYDEQKAREEKEGERKKEDKPQKVKIRPLSDARAIELGANFFSEAFIFAVAVGLLLLENYRSSRKASSRRDEVAERLSDLEVEVERLRKQHDLPELEALNERISKSNEAKWSWWNSVSWVRRTQTDASEDDAKDKASGEAEGSGSKTTSGNAAVRTPANTVQSGAPANSKISSLLREGKDEKREGIATPPELVDTVKATKRGR